ncbi:hypothetical protein NEDG_00314 [Nematocida displodere]|uniref:Uncharacterized protein n=1 Tax=Nematocida displodere TaxID=1805483 RepID=A0A177ELI6_9MICR|nr:hypothetical protein NEDG_00314 [Nematocida displodere]
MIIKSVLLTTGKTCLAPKRYAPNREVFEKFAYLYDKEPGELFEQIQASVDDASEEEELSSEEKEDDEIRPGDRLALALVVDQGDSGNDKRLEAYLYDSGTDAFYIHHDVFVHGEPTSLTVFDRSEDPLAFISTADGNISGYNVFVANHFLPDLLIEAHEAPITSLESNATTLLSTDGAVLKGWDIETQKSAFASSKLGTVSAISINDEDIMAASGKAVYRFDRREGAFSQVLATDASVTAIKHGSGSIAAGTETGTVYFSRGGAAPVKESLHQGRINTVDILKDKYVAATSTDETLSLFDTQHRELVLRKEMGLETVTISMARDSETLYVFPKDDGELDLGSFEEALAKTHE